jgi:hypothetical protein
MKLSIEQKIAALDLMVALVENVGPADLYDAEQVALYDMAQAYAESMVRELCVERDARAMVKRSIEADPSWKQDMVQLNKLARQKVKAFYEKAE